MLRYPMLAMLAMLAVPAVLVVVPTTARPTVELTVECGAHARLVLASGKNLCECEPGFSPVELPAGPGAQPTLWPTRGRSRGAGQSHAGAALFSPLGSAHHCVCTPAHAAARHLDLRSAATSLQQQGEDTVDDTDDERRVGARLRAAAMGTGYATAAAEWANKCMTCCHERHPRGHQPMSSTKATDACRLCDAGLPWWEITSGNRELIRREPLKKTAHPTVPVHFSKTVEFGTFLPSTRHTPIEIVIKSPNQKNGYPHCSSPWAYVPTELWAELLFNSAGKSFGVGAQLLGAHFDTTSDNTTDFTLELYVERVDGAIGSNNGLNKDGGIKFKPTETYTKAVTTRPRAVARAILQLFRRLGQPPDIAFQLDVKAEQFVLRPSLKDVGAFEMLTIDPPLFVGGQLNSKLNKARFEAMWGGDRQEARLLKFKHHNCRAWNVNVACRTHTILDDAVLLEPCNGLTFTSSRQMHKERMTSENHVELDTDNRNCAIASQCTQLLDVLSRPYFFPYIARHDPAILTLSGKLFDYLNNSASEAGSTLPFDTALQMLDELDSECKSCTTKRVDDASGIECKNCSTERVDDATGIEFACANSGYLRGVGDKPNSQRGVSQAGMWRYIRVPKANSRLIRETLHKWRQPTIPVTFTFVRHPVDRFLSGYGETESKLRTSSRCFNVFTTKDRRLKFQTLSPGLRRAEVFLREFLNNSGDWTHLKGGRHDTCRDTGIGHHICKASDFNGRELMTQDAGSGNKMYVGKIETWEKSLTALSNAAGVDIDSSYFTGVDRHVNGKAISVKMTAAMREVLLLFPDLKRKLEDHFRADFCLFGYDITPQCTDEDVVAFQRPTMPELVFL